VRKRRVDDCRLLRLLTYSGPSRGPDHRISEFSTTRILRSRVPRKHAERSAPRYVARSFAQLACSWRVPVDRDFGLINKTDAEIYSRELDDSKAERILSGNKCDASVVNPTSRVKARRVRALSATARSFYKVKSILPASIKHTRRITGSCIVQ